MRCVISTTQYVGEESGKSQLKSITVLLRQYVGEESRKSQLSQLQCYYSSMLGKSHYSQSQTQKCYTKQLNQHTKKGQSCHNMTV